MKLIAVVCMLIDHLAAFYLFKLPVMHTELFMLGHHAVTPLLMMRLVGRLAFPIFAFLIVEGFLHTRSRVRYGRNLLIFALLSELPWNLIHSGTWHYPSQNVFFTLLLGYLGLCALEYFKYDSRRLLASLLGLLVASVLMRADYGCSGYGFRVHPSVICVAREQDTAGHHRVVRARQPLDCGPCFHPHQHV